MNPLILSPLLALLGTFSGSTQSRSIDHQVYSVSVSEAFLAVENSLDELGQCCIGVDADNGIVVGKVAPLSPDDAATLGFSSRTGGTYFFIVFVRAHGEQESEVSVTTVARTPGAGGGASESGFYSSGSPLSERVYDRIEQRLGPGLLRDLKEVDFRDLVDD